MLKFKLNFLKRIWNSQFISYAVFKLDDKTIIGDPANVELTVVFDLK